MDVKTAIREMWGISDINHDYLDDGIYMDDNNEPAFVTHMNRAQLYMLKPGINEYKVADYFFREYKMYYTSRFIKHFLLNGEFRDMMYTKYREETETAFTRVYHTTIPRPEMIFTEDEGSNTRTRDLVAEYDATNANTKIKIAYKVVDIMLAWPTLQRDHIYLHDDDYKSSFDHSFSNYIKMMLKNGDTEFRFGCGVDGDSDDESNIIYVNPNNITKVIFWAIATYKFFKHYTPSMHNLMFLIAEYLQGQFAYFTQVMDGIRMKYDIPKSFETMLITSSTSSSIDTGVAKHLQLYIVHHDESLLDMFKASLAYINDQDQSNDPLFITTPTKDIILASTSFWKSLNATFIDNHRCTKDTQRN